MVVIKKHGLDRVLGLPRLVSWRSWDKLQVVICSMAGCMGDQVHYLVFLHTSVHFRPWHVIILGLIPLGLDLPVLSCQLTVLVVTWRRAALGYHTVMDTWRVRNVDVRRRAALLRLLRPAAAP